MVYWVASQNRSGVFVVKFTGVDSGESEVGCTLQAQAAAARRSMAEEAAAQAKQVAAAKAQEAAASAGKGGGWFGFVGGSNRGEEEQAAAAAAAAEVRESLISWKGLTHNCVGPYAYLCPYLLLPLGSAVSLLGALMQDEGCCRRKRSWRRQQSKSKRRQSSMLLNSSSKHSKPWPKCTPRPSLRKGCLR
jgi:hypothetical protein